ncbi:MAG: sulfate adenylyltransferase subunit 1 [Crocinitomicaceae bacterium]
MDLIRISTAGSVDDGKSTLIGRLLFDNNALTIEQEELIRKKTEEKGLKDLDLSVLTDGLVAEREQGITIDVANIYFSTKQRKFIITDSPGHEEYTRNMVTGASTADTSIILVDARKGLQEQSHRHFYISHLLDISTVVFCVNKMDLVEYSEDTFLEIAVQIRKMVNKVDPEKSIKIIPISSLKGDNVVNKSDNTPWYTGQTLDQYLHEISTIDSEEKQQFRYDVQSIQHVQNDEFVDYRGYAGRVISGKIAVGDRITALPSGKASIVTEIRRFTEVKEEAVAGDSVSISLADQIDISRGNLLTSDTNLPDDSGSFEATIVWMHDSPARLGSKLVLQAGSREALTKIVSIKQKVDPISFTGTEGTDDICANDIVEIELKTNKPTYLDSYKNNKSNGAFILVHPQTNHTVAIGFKK